MNKMILMMAVATLGLAGLAHAQCNTDTNEIGIFWTEECGQCETCLDSGPATVVYAHVMLINSDQPGGVGGFEFLLVNPDGTAFEFPANSAFISNYILPPTAINITTAPEFVVGLGAPIPWGPCINLVTLEFFVLGTTPVCFGVAPVPNPSIDGHMAYVPFDDPGFLIPMYPNSGPNSGDFTMACLNDPDCLGTVATEEESWGSLKSLYR